MKKIILFTLILFTSSLSGGHSCSLDDKTKKIIFDAAKQGSLSTIKKYIKNGKNTACYNKYGTSLLLKATFYNHLSVIKYLYEAGYDINDGDIENHTPLYISIRNKYTKLALFLLDNGADFSPNNNINPIGGVIQHNDFKIFIKMIEKGLDINNANNESAIPLLSLAIMYNANDIAIWLINNNANINQKNEYGKTPLMYAAHFQNLHIFKLLLNSGANKTIKTNDKRTVTDYITFDFEHNHNIEKEMLHLIQ